MRCTIYHADGEHITVDINHSSVYDAIRDGWTYYEQNAGQQRVWINLAHVARIVEEVDDGR